MNNEYTPDRWTLITIGYSPSESITKILSGWVGGYLDGGSWRLSSGVTEVEDKGDHYLIHNHSGSIYTCYKSREGMSGMSSSVFNKWQSDAKLKVNEGVSIQCVPIEDYFKAHPTS